ncbi:MAG: PEGA domain-containing protein, partial [Bacteroidia bacterium]
HITHKKDIEAKAGEKLNIELNPTPQYGKLNIVTEPPMAIITINGKNYGTTPTTIKDLLIGNYNVELSLKGFATINEKTTISEGKTSNINTKLTNGKEVTISSNPSNSKLYINNKYIGMTPYTCNLSYGNYNLQIEKNKQIEKKVMLLSQTSESNINLVIGKEVIINSTPLNAYLFIDNEYVGKTPYSNKLSYGNHELRIENEGKKNEKNITITQNMRKNIFTLSIPTTPQLGQKYQGGIVSYILKWRDIGYDPNIPHGIIVAPYDQSIGVKWDNDDLTTGAIDTNIGSGKANTDKIVSCQGLGNYAAKLCFDLKLNGYNDWYLPSKGELNQLYINRSLINGFSQNSYWSSSNYNSNYAWLQSFENGYQYTNYKTSLSSVRAIRRF